MKEITKTEVKEYIKTNLSPFFKEYGFLYKPNFNGIPAFFRSTAYGFDAIAFSIISTGATNLLKMIIRHDNVEKIIADVGLVNRAYLTKYEHTCHDSFSPWIKKDEFDSYKDLEDFCEVIKSYMLEYGLPFTNTFSKLENILDKINELQREGKGWLDFLGSDPGHLYRVLIICKLTNDPLYNQKLEKVEEMFSTYNLDEWRPGFEKLKQLEF